MKEEFKALECFSKLICQKEMIFNTYNECYYYHFSINSWGWDYILFLRFLSAKKFIPKMSTSNKRIKCLYEKSQKGRTPLLHSWDSKTDTNTSDTNVGNTIYLLSEGGKARASKLKERAKYLVFLSDVLGTVNLLVGL